MLPAIMTQEDKTKTLELLQEYAKFCNKKLNDTICNIYLEALKAFTFEEVKKTGTKYFTYCSAFPTPDQLKARPTEIIH